MSANAVNRFDLKNVTSPTSRSRSFPGLSPPRFQCVR